MRQQALDFLYSLSDAQRRESCCPFDATLRRSWHYFPRKDLDPPQPGVTLKQLTLEQRGLAWGLIETLLSDSGRRKAEGVLALEEILRRMERDDTYDHGAYGLAVFGDPAAGGPWGWRFQGHHLSLNVTVVPDEGIAVTPAFFGSHPAQVPDGHAHAGMRLLREEQDIAFRLIQGMDETERDRALIRQEAPADIITGPGRERSLDSPQGVPLSALNEARREAAMALAAAYVGNMRADLAERHMRRLREAGADRLHFAWAGALTADRPHYYRIHGPTLLIEYDNTQDGANHAHSVWHDPVDGFGEDLLAKHHRTQHGNGG